VSINSNITGLDELQREFNEAARACKSLEGTITTLKISHDDPGSVKEAIRQMELAIDSKTARYRGNTLVSQMARKLKEKYRKEILELSRSGQNRRSFKAKPLASPDSGESVYATIPTPAKSLVSGYDV
jgi:hypothetical protein